MVVAAIFIVVLAYIFGSILVGAALGYIINRLIDQRFPKVKYRLLLRILVYLASVWLAFFVLGRIMGIEVSLS